MYYHRQLENIISQAATEFACITLYGARQVGKSTMIRNLFPEYEYVTLDNIRERTLAMDDPELFLDAHKTPLIVDEIQLKIGQGILRFLTAGGIGRFLSLFSQCTDFVYIFLPHRDSCFPMYS